MRDDERRYYRKLARLGGKPKRHKRARYRRVLQPAVARDPDHKEQRGYRKQRLQRVHRKEVAELNVNDRKRRQRRRKQPRAAVERQRSHAEHGKHGRNIGGGGQRARQRTDVAATAEQRIINRMNDTQQV